MMKCLFFKTNLYFFLLILILKSNGLASFTNFPDTLFLPNEMYFFCSIIKIDSNNQTVLLKDNMGNHSFQLKSIDKIVIQGMNLIYDLDSLFYFQLILLIITLKKGQLKSLRKSAILSLSNGM